MKKAIGWTLLIIGIAGIIANIVFIVANGSYSVALIINTLVCLIFILGGWQLAHTKPAVTRGIVKR